MKAAKPVPKKEKAQGVKGVRFVTQGWYLGYPFDEAVAGPVVDGGRRQIEVLSFKGVSLPVNPQKLGALQGVSGDLMVVGAGVADSPQTELNKMHLGSPAWEMAWGCLMADPARLQGANEAARKYVKANLDRLRNRHRSYRTEEEALSRLQEVLASTGELPWSDPIVDVVVHFHKSLKSLEENKVERAAEVERRRFNCAKPSGTDGWR